MSDTVGILMPCRVQIAEALEPRRVVASGIDKGAWPQESMHRMLTIVLSLFLALGAAGLAIGANAAGAKGANNIPGYTVNFSFVAP